MKKNILYLGLILTIIMSCASKEDGVKDISINDLQVVLKNNENVQLVDVRTPEEWVEGTIKNAIEINVTGSDFEKKALAKLDKTKPVYIYCRSGGRSKIASELLLKKGFQPYNVLGGYKAWEKEIVKK
ncbi:rhodanese-like domain-containing protein [Tenacibaculum sp. HL-MS23]|uniref:rhodanese-like domain-containing protein n=1 Tax=Tenacibaculum sp. HL-MS23 TaxID=3077734 RepID=UPI0028FC2205|nr:rhodanese-like domain-containing protein [Tenacibaculum sp. HL-MS23]WNW01465.1 rhodanese-like domain-containing protein [Tenacibaculum sp. HL-MS23]